MSSNRYYYYDHDSCAFVEVRPTRTRQVVQGVLTVVAALLLAGLFSFGLDTAVGTPQELALQAENEALLKQLAITERRMSEFAGRLDQLSDADQQLYRTLLRAEPISADVRKVGIGGADRYEQFSRYSAPTAKLMRQTSQTLDRIERQINLQNASYRELTTLVAKHENELAQMPAIMPADGRLISGFGMRHHPILGVVRMHKGVDIVVPIGTPIFASGAGVVKEVGRASGYGLRVVIDHPKAGYETLYAHLSEIPEHIQPGRAVERGEQIALSGNTGLSASPHLHYEIYNRDGEAINPVSFLAPSLTPQQYTDLLDAVEQAHGSLD